jgi:hypothetical protein
MTETQGPSIVRIRLPIRAPPRCLTGLALGSLMILGTLTIWLGYPERFADPCIAVLLLAMGVGTFLAGASWFAVDHAIIVDREQRKVLFSARKESTSFLNAGSIAARQERSDRASQRLVWRVYLVKTTEEEIPLWQGRSKVAASRIAQQLGQSIHKPWTVGAGPEQTDGKEGNLQT